MFDPAAMIPPDSHRSLTALVACTCGAQIHLAATHRSHHGLQHLHSRIITCPQCQALLALRLLNGTVQGTFRQLPLASYKSPYQPTIIKVEYFPIVT